ncbi:MAG: hypothetical protein WC749_15745 [Dehalococcoidia bacterium]
MAESDYVILSSRFRAAEYAWQETALFVFPAKAGIHAKASGFRVKPGMTVLEGSF